jgi:prepilin-type N-terminal cleavage/methylation domain-containing protein
MKRFLHNKKGMTLVEVVVSVVILAVVVVSIVAALTQSSVSSRRLDMIYTANNLAKKHMDELKRFGFSDVVENAAETDLSINADGDFDSDGDYLRTTEITENYDGNSYLAKVKISVDRVVDGAASGHPVVVETLFVDLN